MDPNAALTHLRALLTEYQRRDAAGQAAADMAEHLDSIAQQTAALVEWIDRGGFLPAAWQRPPRPAGAGIAEADRWTVANALRTAASQYRRDAERLAPHQPGIAHQFRAQVRDAERIADQLEA